MFEKGASDRNSPTVRHDIMVIIVMGHPVCKISSRQRHSVGNTKLQHPWMYEVLLTLSERSGEEAHGLWQSTWSRSDIRVEGHLLFLLMNSLLYKCSDNVSRTWYIQGCCSFSVSHTVRWCISGYGFQLFFLLLWEHDNLSFERHRGPFVVINWWSGSVLAVK